MPLRRYNRLDVSGKVRVAVAEIVEMNKGRRVAVFIVCKDGPTMPRGTVATSNGNVSIWRDDTPGIPNGVPAVCLHYKNHALVGVTPDDLLPANDEAAVMLTQIGAEGWQGAMP